MIAHALGGERPGRGRLAERAGIVLAGACILALSARVVIALPWTPVPITGQTLGVLLIGALLGSTGGALSAATYLLAGAAGLPVFAAGGGAGYLLGPTGGYLLGFLPAAWLTGRLFERGWGRRRTTALLALGIGDAALFLPGLAWLAMFVPAKALLPAGLISFMPGEAVKVPLAAILVSRLRR